MPHPREQVMVCALCRGSAHVGPNTCPTCHGRQFVAVDQDDTLGPAVRDAQAAHDG